MPSKIQVTYTGGEDFTEQFELEGVSYLLQTEDMGSSAGRVVARIYRQGEIVYSADSYYADLLKTEGLPDREDRIKQVAEKLHKSAKSAFLQAQSIAEKSKAAYFDELKRQLAAGDQKAALWTTFQALKAYPRDPLFLSFHGYLIAVTQNSPKEGIRVCREAMSLLKKSKTADLVVLLPLFCLNLGRASMAGNKRREAMAAFEEGLKYDPKNSSLLAEMKNFGVRSRPAIPFLERNHPVNIYLGKLRHKRSSTKQGPDSRGGRSGQGRK